MAIVSESSEQITLVRRLRRAGIRCAAVPNGANLRGGAKEGARLKREGLEPGIPDLLIFDRPTNIPLDLQRAASVEEQALAAQIKSMPSEARARVLRLAGCHPGVGLELKRSDGGRQPQGSQDQQRWGRHLAELGWDWSVQHGWRAGVAWLEALGYDFTPRRP